MCVCVCAVTDFPPMIKLAASNFPRRFVGVQGRESPIFVNFAPPEAQNWTNRRARRHLHDVHNDYPLAAEHIARHVSVGSACVDIRQSQKTDVFVSFQLGYTIVFWTFNELIILLSVGYLSTVENNAIDLYLLAIYFVVILSR